MSRDQLTEFCHWYMRDADAAGMRRPTVLARAFVDFFGLAGFPRPATLTGLLRRAAIGMTVGAHLPDSLWGLHVSTGDGGYLIQYQASEWPGAQEHTILHATYEILRERLHDLYPHTGLPRGKRLCREADIFAAAVLMQPAPFACFAQRTGFDVVALQRLYQRSYASLALRLAEVMRHQPLLTVLYERQAHGSPHRSEPAPVTEVLRATVVAPPPRVQPQHAAVELARSPAPAGPAAGAWLGGHASRANGPAHLR